MTTQKAWTEFNNPGISHVNNAVFAETMTCHYAPQDSCLSSIKDIEARRPRQNGHHLADNIFQGILLITENYILNEISLKFVSEAQRVQL